MPGSRTSVRPAKSSCRWQLTEVSLPGMKALSTSVPKKEQIISLFRLGITTIEELAHLTGSRPSYIANVLRQEHLLSGYFDLYTSSERPMNVYSKFFVKRLGFKNTAVARRSVHYLETIYRQFAQTGDRAGQHHTLLMGLTMRNRAQWSDKFREAKIFSQWLIEKLNQEVPLAPATKLMQQQLNHQERTRAA